MRTFAPLQLGFQLLHCSRLNEQILLQKPAIYVRFQQHFGKIGESGKGNTSIQIQRPTPYVEPIVCSSLLLDSQLFCGWLTSTACRDGSNASCLGLVLQRHFRRRWGTSRLSRLPREQLAAKEVVSCTNALSGFFFSCFFSRPM